MTLSKNYLSVILTQRLIFADVLKPKFVVGINEFAHDLNQTRVVEDVNFGAVFGNPVLTAHEVFIVTNDYSTDAKLANQA